MKLTINGVERQGVSKGRKSRQVPAEIERLATVCIGNANHSTFVNAGNTVYTNPDGTAMRFFTRDDAQKIYTFVYQLAKRDPKGYAHVGVHIFNAEAPAADEFYVYFSDKSVANVA